MDRELFIKGEALYDEREWKEIERQREEWWEAETDEPFNEYARINELLEDIAWNAYYNDMHKIDDVAEAYYAIAEYYGDDKADEFLKERKELGQA